MESFASIDVEVGRSGTGYEAAVFAVTNVQHC